MGNLPACMSVCHVHAWCLQSPEEGIRFPRTRVADGCELACGCWESNSGPLEEQANALNCRTISPTPVI